MKQLKELMERVRAVVAQNVSLSEMVAGLTTETDLLSAKLIELAQQNAELTEKVAALTQENAAFLVRFDEVQTQAIEGLDAVAEREQIASSINELLATMDAHRSQELPK